MSFDSFRSRDEHQLDEGLESLVRNAIGAAIEVHRVLGPGLPELVYRNALAHELELRRIRVQVEAPVPVVYKGKAVGRGKIDLLIDGQLVVELKVVDALHPIHRDQVIAYLSAMALQLGLLINFNVSILTDGLRRVIRTKA